jgi:hypothetical protein
MRFGSSLQKERARPPFGPRCRKVCRGIWCPWLEECALRPATGKPLDLAGPPENGAHNLSIAGLCFHDAPAMWRHGETDLRQRGDPPATETLSLQ